MTVQQFDNPVHQHDCDECIFVGADAPQCGERRTNQVDMYIHLDHKGWVEHLPAKYLRVLDAARVLGLVQ